MIRYSIKRYKAQPILAGILFVMAYGVLSLANTFGQERTPLTRDLLNRAKSSSTFKASFTYSPKYAVVGQAVQFVDISTGSPVSWLWDFGDGTTSNEKNPVHIYSTSGFRRVTLVAANAVASKTARKTLTVIPSSSPATFVHSPLTPGPGQTVQFADTTEGSPSSWQWNFGDGATSTAKNPSHVFTREGAFVVTLVAGCSSGSKQGSKTVTVAGMSVLSSSFTYSPASPSVNQAIQFTDTSTGNPTAWSWGFGDGTTSTSRNPSHAYTTAGSKTVTLTVTNSTGSNTATRTVTVASPLAASFTFSPASPTPGQAVQFTDTSTGSPTAWSWSFGDGATSTARNPSHAYATAGSKTVTLTVTSSSGSNSVSRVVAVAAALTASFTFSPASPTAGQSVQFTDTSTGSPTLWQWAFGDGSTSTVRNPSHAYGAAGSYSVTLTVMNAAGQNSTSRVLTVTPGAALAASFAFSPSSPIAGNAVQFTDTSAGNPTTWSWNFGDGTTSTSRNPSHSFSPVGTYTVTLLAGNSSSSDSVSHALSVRQATSAIPADRMIDWSQAGVWVNGVKGIPQYPVGVTCAQPAYSVYPNLSTDSRAGIQAAIDACPAGRAVYLPAGIYRVNGQISLQSGVSLRGAGAGSTILLSSASDSVQLGSSALYSASRYGVSGGIAKGATSLILATTPPAACTVGGLILVDEVADYDLMWHRPTYDSRVHTFVARVTAINGNTISFNPPNVHGFSAGLTPQARFKSSSNVVSLAGVENLTIRGAADMGLYFYESDRCWAKNVEVTGYSGTMAMVRVTRALQTEIRGSYIHDCYGFPNQNDGYGVYLYYDSCYGLIEDNVFNNTATPIIGACTSGNVVSYNYAYRINRADSNWVGYGANCNHGAHGLMTLYEGNILPEWENDGYHGSTSHQMLFRNNFHGTNPDGNTVYRWLINLARASYYHSVVGNVIGDSSYSLNAYEMSGAQSNTYSCVYKLEYPNDGNTSYTPVTTWTNWTATFPNNDNKNTLFRNGNYDYYTRSVVWDESSGHELPDSLYLESRPSWFGSLDWPAIGPDVAGYTRSIPARVRWDTYTSSRNPSDLFPM